VYAGGVDLQNHPKDTRTRQQLATMKEFVLRFVREHPKVLVAGHNQFANKACPSFDTVKWLRSIGVEERNIFSE
jgi:N-acetylmuramoyl-L-alanine amidase